MKFLSPVDGLIVNKAADAVLTIKNDSSNNSHHAKLQLYSLRPDGTNYSSSSLYLDNYSTYLSADEALHLQTNGATRLFIHGSGNVGIGTTAPSGELHVKSSSTNANFYLQRNAYDPWRLSAGSTYLAFMQDSSEKMRIMEDGNVGINVTNPTSKLTVNGTAKFYEYGGSHLTNQAHSSFNFEGLVSSSSSTNGGTVGAYVKITASATSATGAYNAFRSRAYAENTTVNTEALTNYFAEYRNYTSTSAVTLNHHRGLWVRALGVGGNATVTNNYGVFLEVGTAATNNYGIYQSTNAAKNYFAGNVGIGTTSPASKLDVNGAITLSGDSEHTIQRLTTSSINSASTHVTEIKGRQIDLYAYDDIWLRAGTGDNIGFEAGNATRMYIKSDGNVGIGTTNPQVKLHVEGRIRSTYSGNTAWYSGNYVRLFNSQSFGFLNSSGSSIAQINLNGNSYFNGGNVGIGTTSPSAQLQIDTPAANQSGQGLRINRPSAGTHYHSVEFATNGTVDWSVGQNSNDAFEVYENGAAVTTRFTIKEGGNVGIGTTSPSTSLHIVKDASWEVARFEADSYPTATVYSQAAAKYAQLNIYDTRINSEPTMELRADTPHFNIRLDDTGNVLTILDGGNVGIGTTNPVQKLDVSGSARVTGIVYTNELRANLDSGNRISIHDGAGNIEFRTQGGTERMTISYAGNVGIGTVTPLVKLDVAGSQRIVHSSGAAGLEVYTNSAIPTVPQVKIGRDSAQYYAIQVDDGTARLIHRQDESGTGTHNVTNEIWTGSSGGTWTWRVRDNAGVFTRDEMSLNNDGLTVFGSINVESASTNLSQHNTTGALRITTQHGYTSIGAENSSWSHFNTDRAAFYFNKPTEFNGTVKPYAGNSYDLGSSSKKWNRIYGTTIYQGADRVLATRPDVHTALYSTGGNADDYTQFGIYRNYGEGQPTGLGHNTVLHVSQTDGNYGWQITSSTANGADSMWYRQKGTTFGDGTWHQIASRSWVTSQGYASASGNATQAWVNAQAFAPASGNATQAWVQARGYITSQTDSQTLSWGSANGQLTISSGNTVDLDGRYMYGAVTNGGDFNDLTSGKNSDYVAFNASNITDAPDASWYNGLVTTHGNYLSSYIVNKHRTNDWYLSWRDANVTPSANWSRVWHSNDFTATNVNNWNTAYGWGNHGAAGYLTAVPSGYATETYVGTQISNLVSSAPSTLDTLNELAAALGDDPNFATTVTNSIATKLPLAGGTLTGDLRLDGDNKAIFGPNSGWGKNLTIGGNANNSTSTSASIGTTNGNLHIDAAIGNYATYLNFYDGSQGVAFGNGASTAVAWMGPDGDLWRGSSDNSGQKYWHAGDFANNSSNWNTAYGWGNHASAGYLTSLPSHHHDDRYYTETEINNKFNSYTRYQTGSNFVDGTLVRTSIVANVTNGDSYLLEITGKSYSTENYPFKVILQGYIYNDTFISNSALSYGGDFAPTIKVFEDGGYLCFWWERISYWNSFSVNVIDASSHDQSAENQVLAIEDAADATYTKQVVVSVRKSLNQSSDGNWTLGNSTWINHDNDTAFNSYNENIRLRNAANGASVIAFGAEGGAGTPESSLINYSDRLEIRRGNPWKIRIYDTVVNFSGNVEAVGTVSATGGNSTNWNTAYGWGNHGAAGYLTSIPSEYLTQTEGDARYVTPIYNGANDNSGKADFAVGVGGDNGAAISLLGTQFQVGAQDINYVLRLDTSGNDSRIKSWDRDIILSTDASASSTNVRHIKVCYTKPNGSATIERVRIDGAGYTYFHGLDLSYFKHKQFSRSSGNYFRGDSTHLVIGTGGTLHLNDSGSTTVLHGTNVYPSVQMELLILGTESNKWSSLHVSGSVNTNSANIQQNVVFPIRQHGY